MATIIQTPAGTWQAVIRRRGFKTVKKTFKRKTDATTWARNTETAIDSGDYRPAGRGERMTFQELVKEFTKTPDGLSAMSENQRRIIPAALAVWGEHLNHLRLRDIHAETLEGARDQLATRRKLSRAGKDLGIISASTLRKYLSILGSVFRFAVRKRILRVNPLREVHKPPPDDERVRFLSEDEMAALLKAVDTSETPELPVAVRLAAFTGMRKAELFGLTWERVNLKDESIVYHENDHPFVIPPKHALLSVTKNGDARLVPITGPAIDALRAWGKVRPINGKALVFPSRETPSKPLDVRTPWTTALRRAKIQNFRWHDLRHTFASWLMMSGASHIEVAKLTGHRDLKSVLRYSHLAPDHATSLVDRMAARLGPKGDS